MNSRVLSAELTLRESIVQLDSRLVEKLDPARLPAARRDLVVRLVRLRSGSWSPAPNAYGARDGIGLLIVDGFLLRRVDLEHRAAGELLGPGDLLQPWQDDGEHAVYPFASTWRVLHDVTLAVLDRGLVVRLAAYPEVSAALVGRAMARSRRVCGHLVLAQFGSVRNRILLALWHMSDEWGRVRRDCVVLPICLTHEMLGLMVGARRPAVTTALRELAADGLVTQGPGGFLLFGDPPADLRLLRRR